MEQIVLIIHVIAAVSVIGLILIQQGKGAEVGASFGSGASQTIFGSQGSGSFLTHLTAIMAVTFFITTLGLGYLTAHRMQPKSLDTLLEQVEQKQQKQEQGKVQGQGAQSEIPEVPSSPSTK